MVALISLSKTACKILTVIVVAALFYSHLGNAQINPMQVVGDAVLCFNNKLIYGGCNNKDYQLDESGNLHIPCDSANQYCNGPCFSETKSMLNCINNVATNFLFNNGLSTSVIGNALDNGCNNFITQKGTFIEGNDYNIAGTSCGLSLSGSPPKTKFQCFAIAVIIALCSLLLFSQRV